MIPGSSLSYGHNIALMRSQQNEDNTLKSSTLMKFIHSPSPLPRPGQGNPSRLTAANVKVVHLYGQDPLFSAPEVHGNYIQAAGLRPMWKSIHIDEIHPFLFPPAKVWRTYIQKTRMGPLWESSALMNIIQRLLTMLGKYIPVWQWISSTLPSPLRRHGPPNQTPWQQLRPIPFHSMIEAPGSSLSGDWWWLQQQSHWKPDCMHRLLLSCWYCWRFTLLFHTSFVERIMIWVRSFSIPSPCKWSGWLMR